MRWEWHAIHNGIHVSWGALINKTWVKWPILNMLPNIHYLKRLGHDWSQCLFTKIIWHEILLEFLQKVIQNCTNHFGKDWTINRAEITHKSLYL